MSKNNHGILLEKEDYFGGRVKEVPFHGIDIKLGAGIITKENKRMLKLIKKLKIKASEFKSTLTSLLPKPFDMKSAVKEITTRYNELQDIVSSLNVMEFLEKYFDETFVKDFIANCEYHDFLKSDVMYFIKYYKINDMIHKNDTIYSLKWKDLVDRLVLPNCHTNSMVTGVMKYDDHFHVSTGNKKYIAKQVVFALTVKTLDRLISKLSIGFKYSDYIGAVPFIRIYTYYKKPYDKSKLGGFNLVPGKLYKIIPITDNIMMASYSDNSDAVKLKKLCELGKKDQIKEVQKLLDKVGQFGEISDIMIWYWDEGVHYYEPMNGVPFNVLLKKLRNPIKGIKVIGEMVSKKHGYVEGAIESTGM